MEKKKYIKEITCENVIVVENSNYQWGVIDFEGNVVVPFGKYGWIDRFDSGLARVRTDKHSGRVGNTTAIGFFDKEGNDISFISGKDKIQEYYDNDRKKNPEKYAKWGIINEEGEEVLPLIYDNIWNFYGKNRYSTTVEKDGETSLVYFHDLNPSLPIRGISKRSYYGASDDYNAHYGEYSGSYAQDVMNYSDETINDAFEGDPDAYWNID